MPDLAMVKNLNSGPVTLTLKFIGFVRLSRYMFVENIIKRNAAELSCTQTFFATSRNGKESENLVL